MIRPPVRIRMRSANFSASSRSWVVSRIVVSLSSARQCTQFVELAPTLRVEPGRRLVEEQQLRAADDADRHVQPAPLTAGECPDLLVRVRGQPVRPRR
jgi:hypothetical protein